MPGGRETEDQSRRQRNNERENERARIKREEVVDDVVLKHRYKTFHQVRDPVRQQQTERAAEYRKQQTLCQQLSNQTNATRAERQTNPNLFATRGRTRQHQVRNVGARNQQDETD